MCWEVVVGRELTGLVEISVDVCVEVDERDTGNCVPTSLNLTIPPIFLADQLLNLDSRLTQLHLN